MNPVTFHKYQGTGNDFVMIDNRDQNFKATREQIEQMCHRRFGIGADGLILLEEDQDADFKMVYYNSDGRESTMCGNGGRCIVAFAHHLGVFENACTFNAIDGLHHAMISGDTVSLKMVDVSKIENFQNDFVLNTGSPHYVHFKESINDLDAKKEGRDIRNSEPFVAEGINVNFVEKTGDGNIAIRTYERGVEDETYSCGTGAVASALCVMNDTEQSSIDIKVVGGHLKVTAEKAGEGFENIWLIGKAEKVFSGNYQF